ncbi:Aldo/keto reductase [Sarocladium strictum]
MVQVLGKDVGATGFGLMGLTWREQVPTVEESIATMKAAVNNGMLLWSGGEFYGTPKYNSLTLLKAYFTKYPEDADKVIIVIKGGVDVGTHKEDGSTEGTRRSIQSCIDQLGGTKKLDIWNPGRRDPNTPLKETFDAAQEFIDAGKLGGVALSEVNTKTLREGVAAAKIELCELELSMFTPDILNNGIAAICAENDIPVMAYSPIGRGLLSGRFSESNRLPGYIGTYPRFNGDEFKHNLKLVDQTKALAEKKGCTPAQLAVAWVRALSERDGKPAIIPIPGSTTVPRVQENAKIVQLSDDEFKEITDVVENFETAGKRYPDSVKSNT